LTRISDVLIFCVFRTNRDWPQQWLVGKKKLHRLLHRQKEADMEKQESRKPTGRFVWVKDKEGNEFVCPVNALRNPDELTEEEKSRCMDAASPRGLVSPVG
jgi:hypothetical protein